MKDYSDLLMGTDTQEPKEGLETVDTSQMDIPQEAQKYIDMSDEELDELAMQNPEENMNILTEEDLGRFLADVSRPSGNLVSFQSYNYDAPADDPDRFEIHELTDCSFFIVKSMAYEDLLQADITFRSPQDPDLNKLWIALKRHLRNMSKFPDNRWVFFIKVENESDTYVQMMNPIMFFLTRSEPQVEASEEEIDGTLHGGNMIRFLFSRDSVIFGTLDEEDKQEMQETMKED